MTNIRNIPAGIDLHNREWIDGLCRENAREQATAIVHGGAILESALSKKETKVIYALYDMETGTVEFFELM